jgi:alpha-galactosidase
MGWIDVGEVPIGDESPATVTAVASAMVTDGLLAAGYDWIKFDAGWAGAARVGGHLVPNASFTSGITAITNYLHPLGFKLALYTANGVTVCDETITGSYGNETTDANDLASWGVDGLKDDNCATAATCPYCNYLTMSYALLNNSSQRPMFFEVCQQVEDPRIVGISNSQRTVDDLSDDWNHIIYALQLNDEYASTSQPGSYNEPFFIFEGTTGGTATETENRTQFYMDCMQAAPLIFGLDPTSASAAAITVLENQDMISIDQDPLCNAAVTISTSDSGNAIVYSKILTGTNTRAIAFLNTDSSSQVMTANFGQAGLPNGYFEVRDCETHIDMGKYYNFYGPVIVASHATTVIKVTQPQWWQ